MKVWMRFRFAGLIASAQRSMSLNAARERPQITEFFARLAISCTAAKSPSEAIGKPASMMSTPMASRSSATSSFSSCVMVAPGHCSPSRKVVSKMTTRSFSDFVWAVIGSIPSQFECAAAGALKGLSRSPRVPRHICPAGPQGRIRRRSVPRMRDSAEPAYPAVRPIARIFLRVDMECSLISSVNLTGLGKARVNRPAFSEKRKSKSSARNRHSLLPICAHRLHRTGRMSTLNQQTWVRSAVSLVAFMAMLFIPAGTLRFWPGWLYAFVFSGATTILSVYFLKHDPKLVERRMKVGPAAEQRPTQKIIMAITLAGFILLIVLPGLDYRLHWSSVPPWLVLAANAVLALSFAIFFVVLKQNSYAAS